VQRLNLLSGIYCGTLVRYFYYCLQLYVECVTVACVSFNQNVLAVESDIIKYVSFMLLDAV